MNTSKIEWTEATWSPVIGCTKVSAGCKHCYAEREVEMRWSKNPKSIWYGRSFTDVLCRPEAIAGAGSPLRWKKPRRIFVCPRADLFHDDVPDLFIADVFGVMAATPQHTYQVLTKRPERMPWLLGQQGILNFHAAVEECAAMYSDAEVVWPLPNVQIGVSIEDQATADERIPVLLRTPAAVRWVSAEPLLGPVDLAQSTGQAIFWRNVQDPDRRIDWVVAGGESGPDARPMHPDWVRSLRDQCEPSGVPFLFKQWGEWFPRGQWEHNPTLVLPDDDHCAMGPITHVWPDSEISHRVGKHRAARLLDGVLHDAYPEVRP